MDGPLVTLTKHWAVVVEYLDEDGCVDISGEFFWSVTYKWHDSDIHSSPTYFFPDFLDWHFLENSD